MKICLVTKGSLSKFWERDVKKTAGAKITAFGFNGLGVVSYESELEGETEFFQDIARFSKASGSVTVSGLDTDTYGYFRRSAVIADGGRILGVSDAVFMSGDSEYSGGAEFTVYDTSAGRLGVLVSSDLYSPKAVETLVLSGAEIIMAIIKKPTGDMPETVSRTMSFLYGIPIVAVSDGYAFVTAPNGKKTFSCTENSVVDVKTEKYYEEVFYKRRGFALKTY